MQRVRLAAALPVVLVTLTAIFMIWRDATLPILYHSNRSHAMRELYSAGLADLGYSILRVVNAPAELCRAFARMLPKDTAWNLVTKHLTVEDFFYLVGVAAMWFLVGAALGRARSTKPIAPPDASRPQIVFNFVLLAYGMFLFFAAFTSMRHLPDWVTLKTFYQSWDFRVEAAAILWAIPLISYSGRHLIISLDRRVPSR